MAKYDLTSKIGTYLDRHLVFPLLEFLEVNEVYPKEEILQAKIDLLNGTNMVDFEMDIYGKLHGTTDMPAEAEERRKAVLSKMQELEEEAQPILRIVGNQALVQKLRAEKQYTPQYLSQEFNLSIDHVDALYRYAKFQFDCGNYGGSASFLAHVIALVDTSPDSKYYGALWGKLAGEILSGQWETALEDLTRLKDVIGSRGFTSAREQLQQRAWLIHWSLFVYFNHPTGRNGIIDLFFQDKYMNTIQTTCPHLLRYLTTAVITSKQNRRDMIKEIMLRLQQEEQAYKDPVTEFLDCLFVNFDFEAAEQKLRECDELLANDFFLVACREEFIENARLFIFETYCRIHNCIDLNMLASRLGMQQEDAEKWIVHLVREAHLDAKIDSARGYVIMSHPTPAIYEQVIDKCKGLAATAAGSASVRASDPRQSHGHRGHR